MMAFRLGDDKFGLSHFRKYEVPGNYTSQQQIIISDDFVRS